MKRWISLMLVMCLLIGVVPAAAAEGQPPETNKLTLEEKFQRELPDYPVGTAAMEGVQYSVLGSWLIGYARNPSLAQAETALLLRAAGGELIPDPDKKDLNLLKPERVPDFSKASPEVQAEIGSTIGNLLIAYARNPSLTGTIMHQLELFGLAREIPKEEWPQDLPEGEMPGMAGYEMVRLDDTQEGFQIAKAESTSSLMIAYARNPGLVDDLVSMYEQAFGSKTELETITPAVRAAWIRAASGLFISYARNPDIMIRPDMVDFVELFDRYSPIPFSQLVSADTCEPEVKAAQLFTLGGLLIAYARNPSHQSEFERIYAHLNPTPELVPLAEREPLVQAAATNVFGLLQIAYARNPALYGTFMKYLAESGLAIELDPDPEADNQNKWQFVQPDLSLPEVQAARMEAVSAQLIAYARNPSLLKHFDSMVARSYGLYSGMTVPFTPQQQAAQANTLVGMTIAYARNPSLTDKLLDILRTMSIPPLAVGEGYTIDFETETMTVLRGYTAFDSSGKDLGQSVDLAELRGKGELDIRIQGPVHANGYLDPEQVTQPFGRSRTGWLHIPQDGKWPAAPEERPSVLIATHDTVILKPMEPLVVPEEGENRVQYSCDGGKTWQDSNEFTGLEPDTTYTFTVRYGGRGYMDYSVAGGAQEALYANPLSPSPAGLQVNAHTKGTPAVVDPIEQPDGSKTELIAYGDGSMMSVTVTPDGGKGIISIDPKGMTTIVAGPSVPGRRTRTLIHMKNAGPGNVAVVVRPDGTEEIIRGTVNSDVGFYLTVDETVELKFEDRSKEFDDVSGHWGANAVAYVTSREMFAGVSADSFAPNLPMTRGMLVQVLYNLEGKPDTAAGKKFKDVTEKNWYADAVAWASIRKVVSGYPDGSFGGEDLVNREQLAVMLYNFAGKPAVKFGKLDFADASRVSAYAETAIQWAAQNGIMSGDGTNLNPQDNATRAEAASMLMNFVNNVYG